MRVVRSTFVSPRGRVARSAEESSLGQKAVVRSLLHSAERLVHRVVVKVSARLRGGRSAGRCTVVVGKVTRAGWSTSLVGISSRSNLAASVRVRNLVVHAVRSPVLNIVVARPPSSLGPNAVASALAQATSTLTTRCISPGMVA